MDKKLYDEKMNALLQKLVEARAIMEEIDDIDENRELGNPISVNISTVSTFDIDVHLYGKKFDISQYEEMKDYPGHYFYRFEKDGFRWQFSNIR